MDIREEKARLRSKIRLERRQLDKDERLAWDKAIEQKVLALEEYQKARTVFCYVSYGGEPETRGILEKSLELGKRLAVPKCLEKGVMEATLITSLNQLREGRYGILEPAEGLETIGFDKIDFAVVPAIAFANDGRRLGQGGGYYDRFMAKTQAFTCGICYSRFILEDIPTEPFDMTVMRVITEK